MPTPGQPGGRLRYDDDVELFGRLVGELRAVGYREFGLSSPSDDDQLDAFAHLATEVIPELRRPAAPGRPVSTRARAPRR